MARIYPNELRETIVKNRMTDPHVKFQQDNAPIHTARVAKNVLSSLRVKVLPRWVASPDLNPVQNFWNQLKRRLVRSYSNEPKDNDQLWTKVQQ